MHSVLDIFLDESTESRVFELWRIGTRISRTVFSKLHNFITEDKANRQEMFERVVEWKVRVNVGMRWSVSMLSLHSSPREQTRRDG